MRFFTLATLILASVLTAFEPRLNHPNSICYDHVSIIDGSYSDTVNDLQLNSAIPIAICRYYSSKDDSTAKNFGQWRLNSHCYLKRHRGNPNDDFEVDGKQHHSITFVTTDCEGRLLELSGWAHNSDTPYKLKGSPKKSIGHSNCYEQPITSHNAISNTALDWMPDSNTYQLTLGNGKIKTYQPAQGQSDLFLLVKEQLPSLFWVHYEYDDNNRLLKIWGSTNEGGPEYTKVTFSYTENSIFVTASDQQWVKYHIKKKRLSEKCIINVLAKVETSRGHSEEYSYTLLNQQLLLAKRTDALGSAETITYDPDSHVSTIAYQVGTPIDPKEQLVQFKYEPETTGGKTTVINSTGQKKIYQYNSSLLLTEVVDFLNGNPYRSIRYSWGSRKQKNMLKAETLHDHTGCCHAATIYDYDVFGNVTQQSLLGNLIGGSFNPIELDKRHLPLPNQDADFVYKNYTYAQDGSNRLLEETDNKGCKVQYSYFEDSSLVASIQVWSEKASQKSKTSYSYSDENLLVSKITDDSNENSCDFTQQEKWTFEYSNALSSWGLPVMARYFSKDDNSGKLLETKSISLNLDSCGQIVDQVIKDANGAVINASSYSYDSYGNLISQDLNNGNHIIMDYDELNRLKSLSDVGLNLLHQYEYDLQNNVTKIITIGGESTQHIQYAYDNIGNLTSYSSSSENEYNWSYDDLNRMIMEKSPPIQGIHDLPVFPTTHYKYDIYDAVTQVTDPEGHILNQKNTLRGSPYKKEHAGELVELFKYDAEGTLHRHRSFDGRLRVFEYDYLGRLTGIGRYSENRNDFEECHHFKGSYGLLKNSSVKYPVGITLSSDFDPLTNSSTVHIHNGDAQYTGSKKLLQVRLDPQNNRIEKHLFGSNDDPSLTQSKLLDALGRTKTTEIKNALGNIQKYEGYTYWQTSEQLESIQKRDVNGSYIPLKITYDTLGQVSAYEINRELYKVDHTPLVNTLGQRVPQIYVEDSNGLKFQKIFNALGQIQTIGIYDSQNAPLSETNFLYDLCGNLVRQQDAKIDNGKFLGWQTQSSSYSPAGLITEEVDVLSRNTRYKYDKGRLCQIEFVNTPKVIDIKYNYFGQIHAISSETDDGLHERAFRYNDNELIETTFIEHPSLYKYSSRYTDQPYLRSTRSYDSFKHLSSESISLIASRGSNPQYKIRYQHDNLGRITLLSGPGFELKYEYDGAYVKKISRHNKNGEELYNHIILKRDLSGKILKEKLMAQAGHRLTSWERNGQKSSTVTDFFKESILKKSSYNSYSPLLIESSSTHGKYQKYYEFDDLGQLSSERSSFLRTYYRNSLFQLHAVEDIPFEYDKLGRLASRGLTTLKYDDFSNIQSKTSGSATTTYHYDPFGQLDEVVDSDKKTEYYYDSFGRKILKVIISGDTSKKYWFLYLGSQEIGMLNEDFDLVQLRAPLDPQSSSNECIAFELGDEQLIPIYDLHNNVVALVDGVSRDVVESYDYSAFGAEKIFDEDGLLLSSSQVNNPWRFAGARKDNEYKLIYFGVRHYDPELESWLSPDPQGTKDCPNLYAYARNNPLRYFDPFGFESEIKDETHAINDFFFGELEPHCLCEMHRNCKRGGSLRMRNIGHAVVRSGCNWMLENIFNKNNFYAGKFCTGFDNEDLLLHPSQEFEFIDACNLDAIVSGNAVAADWFPADESAVEYQLAFQCADVGMTALTLLDFKSIGKFSSKLCNRGVKRSTQLSSLLNYRPIKPYNVQRKLTKGFKGQLQAHHIVEKRHLKRFGYSRTQQNLTPAVILNKDEHLKITNALRNKLPYGADYIREDVLKVLLDVYSDYPEWIKVTLELLGPR